MTVFNREESLNYSVAIRRPVESFRFGFTRSEFKGLRRANRERSTLCTRSKAFLLGGNHQGRKPYTAPDEKSSDSDWAVELVRSKTRQINT